MKQTAASGRWCRLVLAISLLSAPCALVADSSASLPLDVLMAKLFADLQILNHGLLHSEFDEAATAAERIANHPLVVPAQRALIAGTLGREMAEFKDFDTVVHDAALALSAAARRGDQGVMAGHYADLTGGCIGCHARFRDRVREALGSK